MPPIPDFIVHVIAHTSALLVSMSTLTTYRPPSMSHPCIFPSDASPPIPLCGCDVILGYLAHSPDQVFCTLGLICQPNSPSHCIRDKKQDIPCVQQNIHMSTLLKRQSFPFHMDWISLTMRSHLVCLDSIDAKVQAIAPTPSAS